MLFILEAAINATQVLDKVLSTRHSEVVLKADNEIKGKTNNIFLQTMMEVGGR